MDTIGKQLLEEEPNFIYKYKGHVPVGILGIVDDVAGVSESGRNIKTAEKKLQFGVDKCHTLIIANKNVRHEETDLHIDHWSEKHDKEDNLIEHF